MPLHYRRFSKAEHSFRPVAILLLKIGYQRKGSLAISNRPDNFCARNFALQLRLRTLNDLIAHIKIDQKTHQPTTRSGLYAALSTAFTFLDEFQKAELLFSVRAFL